MLLHIEHLVSIHFFATGLYFMPVSEALQVKHQQKCLLKLQLKQLYTNRLEIIYAEDS